MGLKIRHQTLVMKTINWGKIFFAMFFLFGLILAISQSRIVQIQSVKLSLVIFISSMFCFAIAFFFSLANIACLIYLRKTIHYAFSLIVWICMAILSLLFFFVFLLQSAFTQGGLL